MAYQHVGSGLQHGALAPSSGLDHGWSVGGPRSAVLGAAGPLLSPRLALHQPSNVTFAASCRLFRFSGFLVRGEGGRALPVQGRACDVVRASVFWCKFNCDRMKPNVDGQRIVGGPERCPEAARENC